ncbi:hypothetical protein HDU93_006462, partial [Gonapodya sp. JEL0774]
DFHLAKRYYDRALSVNSHAYLPVNLALVKLSIRRFFSFLTGEGRAVPRNPQMQPGVDGKQTTLDSSTPGLDEEESEYRWWKKERENLERRMEWGLIVVLSVVLMILLRVRTLRLQNLRSQQAPAVAGQNTRVLPEVQPTPPPSVATVAQSSGVAVPVAAVSPALVQPPTTALQEESNHEGSSRSGDTVVSDSRTDIAVDDSSSSLRQRASREGGPDSHGE